MKGSCSQRKISLKQKRELLVVWKMDSIWRRGLKTGGREDWGTAQSSWDRTASLRMGCCPEERPECSEKRGKYLNPTLATAASSWQWIFWLKISLSTAENWQGFVIWKIWWMREVWPRELRYKGLGAGPWVEFEHTWGAFHMSSVGCLESRLAS